MITEARLKHALKDMLQTMPLEKINVTALCKRCGCHRQTFYYHYQDIYDLVAAICLNEDLSAVENAPDVLSVLLALADYVKENFAFLKAAFNSAAKDLIDDFLFGKINARLFALWSRKPKEIGLSKEGVRNASRRFAHFVADEFGFYFKDAKLTPEKFTARVTAFINNSVEIILPSIMELSKKGEAR